MPNGHSWIANLDEVAALNPAVVVAGHKKVDNGNDPKIIGESQQYLRDFSRIVAEETTAAAIVAAWSRFTTTGAISGPFGTPRDQPSRAKTASGRSSNTLGGVVACAGCGGGGIRSRRRLYPGRSANDQELASLDSTTPQSIGIVAIAGATGRVGSSAPALHGVRTRPAAALPPHRGPRLDHDRDRRAVLRPPGSASELRTQAPLLSSAACLASPACAAVHRCPGRSRPHLRVQRAIRDHHDRGRGPAPSPLGAGLDHRQHQPLPMTPEGQNT